MMAHTNRSHLIDFSARPAQIKTGVSGLGNNKLTKHHDASSYDRTCDKQEANPSITQREKAVEHPTGDVPISSRRAYLGRFEALCSNGQHPEARRADQDT
ncbi:hypothetical protein F443_23214 [Phytophthora nicotianae P1569]|uniref:Uncharacterized protein n=1 Tax=Phytophthora nicotianae P1569 TaxID=1317065 RepID=V9DRZ5_PHYNI|nr:hypothetical protein F443_23214 [Phytophthora nicotianae P1569]